ncbi:hypothetical protein [Dactylosporangium sp. NPDC006015]|uniref:hypothetical protein n=1 Tax=Dactylosporangium sp. NPDC006015 TaxID=3154576 RepID=UPI0033B28F6D
MTIRINRHTVADERIVAATDDFPRRVATLVDAEQEGGPGGTGWDIDIESGYLPRSVLTRDWTR